MILADAFRSFHYNKATLIYNLDSLINYAELTKDLDPSLVMKPEIEIKEEYPIADELQNELTVFGFYLTHHPVAIYKKNYKESIDIVDIPKYFSKRISTLVLIERIKVINTKKGDKMAFLTVSDENGSMNFTLFPKVYQKYALLTRGNIIKVVGMVEKRLNEYQVIVEKIDDLTKGDSNEEK